MIYDNFEEVLKDNAEKHGEHTALIYEQTRLSYRELYEEVLKRAQEMRGISAGCVGIYGPLSIQWIIDMFGSAIAGKRTVLLDPMQGIERTNELIAATGVEYVTPVNPGLTLTFHERDEIEQGGCLLFFTSGTTSYSKAVVLSQRALCRSVYNGQSMLAAGEEDIIMAMLPMNHVFGFVCTMLWPLANGAAVAVGRGLRKMQEDPSYYHVTILPAVPTLVHFLLAHHGFNEELKTILIGASPIDKVTLAAISRKKIKVSFGYGLTETASGLAISVDSSDPYGMDLCPDTKIRIGDDGSVYVRTPCMMEGYYHNQFATDEVLKDGELDTGDLGEIDRNGCLRIYGRKNDVLVLPNGQKMFLPEWEEKLSAKVNAEVALSLEDGKLAATIVTDRFEHELWPAVNEFNKETGFGQKITRLYLRSEKLPRTVTGKIQRWLLQHTEKKEEKEDDRSGDD